MAAGRLVHAAESALRQWLKKAKLDADGRLPSERALSRLLNIQQYAVNRAMAKLIAEGTVRRDRYKLYYSEKKCLEPAAAAEFDLVISRRSVHLASYKRVGKELGLLLRIHFWEAAEEAVSILTRLLRPETQCVIFDPPFGEQIEVWEGAAGRLVQNGIPVVCVGQQAANLSSVTEDSNAGMRMVFQHLLDLGHRELAFAGVSPRASSSTEMLTHWKWECERHELASSAGRILYINNSRLLPEDARDLARRFGEAWKAVTALIVYPNNEFAVQNLLDEFERNRVQIPKDLSLAFLGDSKSLTVASTPVTAIGLDMALLHEAALLIGARALRRKERFGLLPQPSHLLIQERLIPRASTAPGPFYDSASKAAQEHEASVAFVIDPGSQVDPETAWRKPYDLVAKAADSRFDSVDLSQLVNRPINFRKGWLGDLPLKRFHPGRHVVHGVPFHILGGATRADCAAVVLYSAINMVGSAKKLPSHVTVPVGSQTEAIYVLHGCGYASYLRKFAQYRFFSGDRLIDEVPLVVLGKPLPNLKRAELDDAIATANIQDWWPDYPHYDFAHARMVPVQENEDPEGVGRHVYVYTLEWMNPSPELPVTHIEIESDPEQSTTLGILGITALRPAEPGRSAAKTKRL